MKISIKKINLRHNFISNLILMINKYYEKYLYNKFSFDDDLQRLRRVHSRRITVNWWHIIVK